MQCLNSMSQTSNLSLLWVKSKSSTHRHVTLAHPIVYDWDLEPCVEPDSLTRQLFYIGRRFSLEDSIEIPKPHEESALTTGSPAYFFGNVRENSKVLEYYVVYFWGSIFFVVSACACPSHQSTCDGRTLLERRPDPPLAVPFLCHGDGREMGIGRVRISVRRVRSPPYAYIFKR